MSSTNFDDFYNDDNNVPPVDRAKIDLEVEIIGKIIEAREKGMTQEQLIQATGLPRSVIARIETMKDSPKIDKVCKLLAALGYKLEIVPLK